MQLNIFSIIPNSSSGELPKTIAPIDQKVEEAVKHLLELKQIVIAQFQVGTRVIAGDLHGEVASVIDEILCMIRFDGELKPRQVFTDSLELEYKPVLVEGCTVRSSVTFKEKTGIFLKFHDYAGCNLALVRYEYRGSTIDYYCTIATLEVVK